MPTAALDRCIAALQWLHRYTALPSSEAAYLYVPTYSRRNAMKGYSYPISTHCMTGLAQVCVESSCQEQEEKKSDRP